MKAFINEQVWIHRIPLRFFGMEYGTRMTIVRLDAGGLLVHSPVRPDDTVRRELDRLGPVEVIVSPNKLHHLFLRPFAAAYPKAKLYAPPGLAAKRQDISFHGALGDQPEDAWTSDLDQVVFRGSFFMEEVVFFHRASGTLIVGDLLENFHAEDAFLTRLLTRMAGMYGRPCMPTDWRWSVRDKSAARASVAAILDWDFDRIILAHGRLVQADGKAVFEKAFSWLRGASGR